MSKASGLGDNEDWENCGDETLFDKISSISPQNFINKYTNATIALETIKPKEKHAFILAMIRNPALSSFVLDLKHSPQISTSLWHTIHQQVQDEHIAISNGWVTKLLKDKSDAYSYVMTNQPKEEEIAKTDGQAKDYEWDIFTFLGGLLTFSFFTEKIAEIDSAIAGNATDSEQPE
jgi:hypothetical protein